ncbi:hypothetical protein C7S13_4987 [Burkholderia cepacia]|nr:hypothetical protein [Burkholderia cepacia]
MRHARVADCRVSLGIREEAEDRGKRDEAECCILSRAPGGFRLGGGRAVRSFGRRHAMLLDSMRGGEWRDWGGVRRDLPSQLRGECARFHDRELGGSLVRSLHPVTCVGHAEQAARPGRVELDEHAPMAAQPYLHIGKRLPGAGRSKRHAQVVRPAVGRQRRRAVDPRVAADIRDHVAPVARPRRRRLGRCIHAERGEGGAQERASVLSNRGRHCNLRSGINDEYLFRVKSASVIFATRY